MKWLLRFLLVLYAQALFGQPKSGKIEFNSEILAETRVVEVFLPEGYHTGDASYPVVYVLDGEWHAGHLNWCAYQITDDPERKEAIVVGIINVDRNRDFLPTHVGKESTSGGAGKFLRFIEQELKPYINEQYCTSGGDVIVGHSFGGVFAMYALLMEPELFDGYLISDPAFWWDDDYLMKLATRKLRKVVKSKQLFIAGRSGSAYFGMGISRMESTLKKYAPDDIRWEVMSYPNETHDSVVKKSFPDGMAYLADILQPTAPGCQ